MHLIQIPLKESYREVAWPLRWFADCQSAEKRTAPDRYLEAANGGGQPEPLLTPNSILPGGQSATSIVPAMLARLSRQSAKVSLERQCAWKEAALARPRGQPPALHYIGPARLPALGPYLTAIPFRHPFSATPLARVGCNLAVASISISMAGSAKPATTSIVAAGLAAANAARSSGKQGGKFFASVR